MAAVRWEKASLKPGDVITAMGYQFTDGQKILRFTEDRGGQRQRDVSVR